MIWNIKQQKLTEASQTKFKKLFYVIIDNIGQKGPRMSDPFIVHTLIVPNILRKIADHKMLTPVLFAATWRAPLDGFHLKVLGTEGGRACPSVGRPPTTRRAGSTMSSKLWWWCWFWLVWLTIMETCLLEWFLYLRDLNKNIPLVSTFVWYICRKRQKIGTS